MKPTKPILFLLLFVFISACNSTTPTPTSFPTVVPDTQTSTPAFAIVTLTPQATATRAETPTPEVKLNAANQAILDAADPIAMPKDVVAGSAPDKIGIPVGAKLTVENGALVYVVKNPAGQDVVVGQLDKNGKLEKGDAILYKLCATPEEAVNCKLPLTFVLRGGPAQIAKLTAEPFPAGVKTDTDVVVEANGNGLGDSGILLKWSQNDQAYFAAHPEELPVRVRGYYTVQGDRVFWGQAEDWQLPNKPDGSPGDIRSLTYMSAFDLRTYPNANAFPAGEFVGKGCRIQPYCEIGRDPARGKLIEKWAEQNYPPAELSDTVLVLY